MTAKSKKAPKAETTAPESADPSPAEAAGEDREPTPPLQPSGAAEPEAPAPPREETEGKGRDAADAVSADPAPALPDPSTLPLPQEPTEDEEPPSEPSVQPAGSGEPAGELERELTVYPLREGTADPGWAVRTVWGWTGFTLFCLVFILTLLVLGLFYD